FALALAHLGKTRTAMREYAAALLLRPDFPEALNGLAWILAADPNPEIRNVEQALSMSAQACELTSRTQAPLLATLAAAQASAGKFADAISTINQARDLAAKTGPTNWVQKCAKMLQSFEKNEVFLDSAPPKSEISDTKQ